MKYHEAVNEAESHFLAQWGSRTLVSLPNEKTKEPTNPKTEWVRLSVRETGGGGETLGDVGNRKYWRQGSVFVQVFTEILKGTNGGGIHASAARDIFEGRSINGLYFTDAQIRDGGSDGKFWQTLVEAYFNYEETK